MAIACFLTKIKNPHPDPLPEYMAREKEGRCDCPVVKWMKERV
jgi:hypothetical protein